MDKEVIENKLENLRRCVVRIEQKTPTSVSSLMEDLDTQDIIVLNLERAIQACVDIGLHIIAGSEVKVPDSMAETFRILGKMKVLESDVADHLSKAVGFRNTAVHAYQEIDWAIVFSIITERTNDFRDFSRQIMSRLERHKAKKPVTEINGRVTRKEHGTEIEKRF